MVRSDAGHRPRAWASSRRLAAAGAVVGLAVLNTGFAAAPQTALTAALVAPPGAGLAWPGWTVRDPAEQQRAFAALLQRERRTAVAVPALPLSTVLPTPTASPAAAQPAAAVAYGTGDGTLLVGPEAVATALRYALAQLGKPYVWGAEGPDAYDCSGLTRSAYAAAGVALPRTSVEQARVGQPVELADLLPGDLVFWAYDPANPATVHHVALYLGGGMVVHAPQPGDVVRVSELWLSGYAGAVRVAGGPATATLPAPPPGGTVPSTLPAGSVPPVAAGSSPPGTIPPGTTLPGSTPPGTTPPGTILPTTPPPTTPPPTTPPPTTPPPTTPPPTTPSPTTPPPTTPPPTPSPSGTIPPTTPDATTPAPTTPPPTTPPPTTPPPTTPPPTTPPPTTPASSPESTPTPTPTSSP